jgi:hypothetical protein
VPSGSNFIVVIQNTESGHYLKKSNEWAQQIKEAVVFEHILDASLYASKMRLMNYHIVMSFGDPRYDVRIRD